MIKLTATRAAVLAEVAKGNVQNCYSHGAQSGRINTIGERVVDSAVRHLHGAGLIFKGPASGMYAPRTWQLTEAGEAWLAQNCEHQ